MSEPADDDRVNCQGLTPVFALLGKRWSGLIIGTLLAGPARFSEMSKLVPGVTERMLSGRLSELIVAGLVEREVFPGPPVAVRYRLTVHGEALRPALLELERWAAEHLTADVRNCPTTPEDGEDGPGEADSAAAPTAATPR